mgnify:FL=1
MTVYRGETVRIKATIKDFSGNLFDPDSQEIKIYDPSNTLKETNTSPTKESVGVYYIDYNIPSDSNTGVWYVEWKVVKSDKTGKERYYFEVQ